MRRVYLAIAVLFLSSCSALTLHQATESLSAKRETSEKKETRVIETGSPPLVSKSTTINVESEGAVNIRTPEDTSDTSGAGVLSSKIIKALAEIKNSRNTDQKSTFKETVEAEFYKKMTALGGLFFILVAVACLLMVRAIAKLRQESTKWGFDPKTVGHSAHKMLKMITSVDDLVTRETSSLVNKLTANGLSEETSGQINRQIMKLNELKKILDRADNIQRTHYGA